MTTQSKLRTALLTGFIALKFLLQYLLLSPAYELQRDEYLYLDQAHHWAWGYLSVPPVTSWLATLIYWLGGSLFWIKFFPALFGVLTLVVVWKVIAHLKGSTMALVLGATGLLLSCLLRLNTLFQPNSVDVFCWTAFYACLIYYFSTERAKWLYWAAVAFAFGFLNKYNVAFMLMGLLPALLLTPWRRIFLKKELYWAIGLGLLLILPNLLWQYQNHFPVVHHMQELRRTQLVHVDLGDFMQSQLFFFIGSVPVLLAGGYALMAHPPFKPYRIFFWSFLFTMAVFLYFKAKDYYVIGLYPIYIAFGAVYLGQLLANRKRWIFWPVLLAIPLFFFGLMLRFAFPDKSPDYIREHADTYRKVGMLRWEDGKEHPIPQDFADMLGWKELAQKVDKVYAQMPNKGQTLVLCDNYGQAGAINFYSKEGIRAASFNADYLHWFDLSIPYKNVIRVKEAQDGDTEMQKTAPYFEKAVVEDSITNPYARERGTVIFGFTGAKIDVNKRVAQEIKEVEAYWNP